MSDIICSNYITNCSLVATGYYEYDVMFTEPAHPLSFTPQLYILSEQNGTVMIHSLSENTSKSMQLSCGENRFDLENSVFLKDGTALKGVYVNTYVPIVLYAFILYSYASDGYLAMHRKFL